GQHMVRQAEVEVGVQQVQVLHRIVIRQHPVCKTHYTVEHTEGVAHTAFALLRYYVQGGLLRYYAFLSGYAVQVVRYIFRYNPFKIEYLATAEDGRQYLMFLRSGQYEY